METAIVEKPKNALEALACRLQVSKEALQQTLKKTAFQDCKTNEEFIACVIVANTYKLNPILKELYAFSAKGGAVVPIVSVDGWIKISRNHPDYDGVELIENKDQSGKVVSVTAKFYLKNVTHPVMVTEYMEECFQPSKEPWKKWPIRMLRHKAYIQGARVAFGFSGIYDEDEAERIVEATAAEVKAIEEPEMPRPKETVPAPAAETPKAEPAPAKPENGQLASPEQLSNLRKIAGQAGITNDGDWLDFMMEAEVKRPDAITVTEYQDLTQKLMQAIDKKAAEKTNKTVNAKSHV